MRSNDRISLATESYIIQQSRWPDSGRVILGQYDDESVVVYQAYRPEIGLFAAKHGYFGGPFSLNRMTWIKTSFLWMMYRSGWGSKRGQEVVLAVRIRRDAFDQILSEAVFSSFDQTIYPDEATWKKKGKDTDVRLQWDPDHAPGGQPLRRRAIQLGLRGQAIRRYAREWVIGIEDISHFVRAQFAKGNSAGLVTPSERVFFVEDT